MHGPFRKPLSFVQKNFLDLTENNTWFRSIPAIPFKRYNTEAFKTNMIMQQHILIMFYQDDYGNLKCDDDICNRVSDTMITLYAHF